MESPVTTRSGRALEDLDNDIQLINKCKQDFQTSKKPKIAKNEEPHEDKQTNLDENLNSTDNEASKDGEIEHHEEFIENQEFNAAQDTKDASSSNDSLETPKTSTAEGEEVSQAIEILREKATDFVGNTDTSDVAWNAESEYLQSIDAKTFRQYDLACDRVKEFYEQQHRLQTVAYNIQARINFKAKIRAKMTVWEGLEKLNKLLDESDPDTELSQIDHALQTAEAIRRDKKPRWMQLVGLIHDLGKLLYFFDSKGQWDVVGDTFPVGCSFLTKIIFSESFRHNPDFLEPSYNTKFGIYSENCGLDKVMLSWGHDEYMYHIAKLHSTLPPEGLAMIRYHSFYPWHQENAYQYLMNDNDVEMLKAVRAFNKYDLYSKADEQYNVDLLKPYYLDLIDEFFPKKLITF